MKLRIKDKKRKMRVHFDAADDSGQMYKQANTTTCFFGYSIKPFVASSDDILPASLRQW